MLTWVPVFAKKGTTVHEPEPPQDTRTPRGVKVEITCAWCALTGMVPFFTRFLKSVDALPTLTRLGGRGAGRLCRVLPMVPFFANTGTHVSIDFEEGFRQSL